MHNSLIELNYIREKKELLEELNTEYLLKFQEHEDMIKKKKLSLESIYLMNFGGLINKKFELNLEYRKLKAKLSKIISALNSNIEVDLNKIDKELDDELKNFMEEIKDFKEKLRNSKDYFNSPLLTDEESKEVKSIFRYLAKKLHPDIVGDIGEKAKQLWQQALDAYDNNNLITLIVIKDIFDNNEDINAKTKVNFDEQIERIKNAISNIEKDILITKSDFPFNIEDKLYDKDFIENKKLELSSEIKTFSLEISKLNSKIKSLV
ncbi:hypothetical protein ACN077_17690 [Clostridium chromiireducens]|uniref:hypothetical protein n=1 Tax=Clostridium chromiireducens TaxID=225345 RepID=UPI003AF4ECA0